MSEASDYRNLHYWVDRLTPAQARHLKLDFSQDGELPKVSEERGAAPQEMGEGESVPQGLLDLIGMVETGRTDMGENHEAYFRERFRRRDSRSA